jgi:16S rRNA (cytosine(967)-C(5))-methyltransferase
MRFCGLRIDRGNQSQGMLYASSVMKHRASEASPTQLRHRPLREDLVLQACLEAFGAIRHEGRLADRALEFTLRHKKHLYSSERKAVAERVYALLRRERTVDYLAERTFPPSKTLPTAARDAFKFAVSRALQGEPPEALAQTAGIPADQIRALERLPDAASQLEKLPRKERYPLAASLPDFLAERFLEEFGEEAEAAAEAMNERAPLCARTNLLKGTREELIARLAEEDVIAKPAPWSSTAIFLDGHANAFALNTFREGYFEIQDEGSQLLGQLADPPPTKVVDACAGAGGKTLQMAAEMKNRGELFALDIEEGRLEDLKKRARRGGVHNVRSRLIPADDSARAVLTDLEGKMDRVLVDAPCSGSGTLRRKPDARYRLTPEILAEHIARQKALLERFAPMVKPGGRLVYGTCSVLRSENEDVIEDFLSKHPDFSMTPAQTWLGPDAEKLVRNGFLRLFPHKHGTDGFFAQPDSGPLRLQLPVWTPGSYLVREYARHLQDFSATTSENAPLAYRRTDKRTFEIDAKGSPVTVRYRVYANELTVRTSHLDSTHGYFNGATLFLYSEPLRNTEHRVQVAAPDSWEAFCSLDKDGNEFVAPNYDDLIDSPFEVGPHTPVSFTAAGVPHQLIVWGDPLPDLGRLTEDIAKVVEAEARLFGGLPLRRYLFLVYLSDKGRGGLEHKASTALLYPRFSLGSPKGWEDFLSLVAHEYFHLWNVKRIKPKALVPFDYSQENYTQLLWAFEGVTSFYDLMFVRRAGLLTPSRYLTRLGEAITALQGTPGRKVQSLADASMNAWIKHYRPDEHSPNSAISYYLKGEVVAALLDLEIRRATNDAKSLDDVMLLLWEKYGNEQGVPEDGIEAAASAVAGKSLAPFFDRAIRGTEELDYSVFAHVGLELKSRQKESSGDKGGTPPRGKSADERPKGYVGFTLRGVSTISSVLDGAPAMEAGLYADDEIIALDGYKVDGAGLLSRCEEKRPRETVRVTVFRRDKLVEVPLTLGAKPADSFYLARMDHPTEAQRNAYGAWLQASWEDAG